MQHPILKLFAKAIERCHVQGMIKDMHVGLGSLHRRMDALEAGGGSGSAADPGSLKELRVSQVVWPTACRAGRVPYVVSYDQAGKAHAGMSSPNFASSHCAPPCLRTPRSTPHAHHDAPL